MNIRDKLGIYLMQNDVIKKDFFMSLEDDEVRDLASLHNIYHREKQNILEDLVKSLAICKIQNRVKDSSFAETEKIYKQAFIEETDTYFDEGFLKKIEMNYEQFKNTNLTGQI
jgi:hypothetical protein